MRRFGAMAVLVGVIIAGAPGQSAAQVAYPLRISDDGRHFVDQSGAPYLMNGDSPWSLIGELTREEAEIYLRDCADRGINSLIVTLVDGHYTTNPPTNAYETQPFTTPGDFGTPNEAYFAHADWVIDRAAELGIQLVLAPVYLGCCSDGWFAVVRDQNTAATMRGFGRWVGARYRDRANLMYSWGNDIFPPEFAQVREKIRAMAEGLREADDRHLVTYHGSPEEAAFDVWDPRSEGWLDVNAVYTYQPVVGECEAAYAFRPTTPFFLFESKYENEHGTTGHQQRVQAYQAILSGASGHHYGNSPIWHMGVLGGNWRAHLDDPGRASLTHLAALFASRAWHRLVPDPVFITDGAGSGDDAAVAARTDDGGTVMAYLPSMRAITVALDRVAGAEGRAWWFDPRSGEASAIGAVPTTGSRTFMPPGGGDWLLVLDDAAGGLPAPGRGTVAPPLRDGGVSIPEADGGARPAFDGGRGVMGSDATVADGATARIGGGDGCACGVGWRPVEPIGAAGWPPWLAALTLFLGHRRRSPGRHGGGSVPRSLSMN